MRFNPTRIFERRYDVRHRERLLERIQLPPMEGKFWPLIGSRRSGKTWTLRALECLLNDRERDCARYVSMEEQNSLEDIPDAQYLLLDEPGLSEGVQGLKPGRFLEWCGKQASQRRRIILAMTPAEWSLLLRAGSSNPRRVFEKNRLYIEPLTQEEARKLAGEPWALRVLEQLPRGWSYNPYLLELLLSHLEQKPEAAHEVTPSLIKEIFMSCDEQETSYFPSVFVNGLDSEQRELIRRVARGESPDLGQHEPLVGCGLLKREGVHLKVMDPVLEALVTPLRIHHVSDVHFGPKAAIQGDLKEEGSHGTAMAQGAGHGPLHREYLKHLQELSQRREAPQVLIASGDLAETGADDQFQQARSWLDSLHPLLGTHPLMEPEADKVLLVGGNHDVDWNEALGQGGSRKRHDRFAMHFKGLKHPGLELPPAERKPAVVTYPNLGVEILLLGSAEFGGEPQEEPEIKQLLSLVDRLREEAIKATNIEEAEKLRNRVARIDPGLVNHEDLSRIRGRKWRHPVNVAVLHHPVSPLPATEIARFSGLLNAGAVKQTLLEAQFCLVLHGHMHMGWFGKEQWPGMANGWTLRIAAAPSLGSKEVQSEHGFNEIEVSRLREHGPREYQVAVRRFERTGQRWEQTAVMTFRPGRSEDLP